MSNLVIYDGKTVPFKDGEFECVLSNSVIEHIPPEQRTQFVSELRRVGQNVIVQTPAWCFPIEPHFVAPFLHWLPRKWGRKLARFTPWAFLGGKSREEVNAYFDEVHLLTAAEFKTLFPDAELVVERFLGIPKSYLMVKYEGWPAVAEKPEPILGSGVPAWWM
jgi:Methyltransferase domain